MTTGQLRRIAFLRDRVETVEASRGRTTFDVPFRQRQISLAMIEIPLDFRCTTF